MYRYLLRLLYAEEAAHSGDTHGASKTADPAAARMQDRDSPAQSPGEPRQDSDQSAVKSSLEQRGAPESGSKPDSRDTAASSTTDPLAQTTTSLDDDVIMMELRGIFDRISQKDQSRAAIRELYTFQNQYPAKQADIQRSLQNTGPIFQRYIKRALANHATEDAQKSSASISASVGPASEQKEGAALPASTSASARARPWSPTSRLNRGTRESGATMDARLAELKAKFRKDADVSKMPGKPEQRTSMSSEALRQRLNSMRPDS